MPRVWEAGSKRRGATLVTAHREAVSSGGRAPRDGHRVGMASVRGESPNGAYDHSRAPGTPSGGRAP